MLPLGLRLTPKIFNAVADALNWYLYQCGIPNILHYIDDFITIGPLGSTSVMSPCQLCIGCAQSLAYPLPSTNMMGPRPALLFLGIEIDTIAEVLQWDSRPHDLPIAVKELIPIIWGMGPQLARPSSLLPL